MLEVTLVSTQFADGSICLCSQLKSLISVSAPVTIKYALSLRRVTVRSASLVQPLRVNDFSRCDCDIIGADPIEYAGGIGTLEAKLGERRLIEYSDRITHRMVFPGAVIEPILTSIAVFVARLDTLGRVPVGAFPAERLAEASAEERKPVVQRGLAHAARGFVLTERPMRGVQQPQAFRDPRP